MTRRADRTTLIRFFEESPRMLRAFRDERFVVILGKVAGRLEGTGNYADGLVLSA